MQGALSQLNALLDELDDMFESSVENIENRLLAVRSAIEKTRTDCARQTVVAVLDATSAKGGNVPEHESALNAETQERDDEMNDLRETVALLQQQLQECDDARAALEEKVQQGEAGKAAAESYAEKLRQELIHKEEHIQQVESTLRAKEDERSKYELEVKMLLGEIEGMQYQRNELEMLQEKVAKLERDLEEERAIIVRLKAQQASAPRASRMQQARDQGWESETAPAPRARAVPGFGGGRRVRKQMGEILVEAGVLTEKQLQEVIELQATDPKRKLGAVVVESGYATEEVIAAALAAQLRVRFIENLEQELQPGVIKLVPIHLINNHRCVPLYLESGSIVVAMANPLDLIGIENIELATNLKVEVATAIPTEIDRVIEKYFNRSTAHQ